MSTWKAKNYERWANYDFETIRKMNGAFELNDYIKELEDFKLPTVDRVRNDIPTSFNASA